MDWHAATRRVHHLAEAADIQVAWRSIGSQHLDRHPNYILAAYMASDT
jgi:hypothetical protein